MSVSSHVESDSIWKNIPFRILLVSGLLLAIGSQVYQLVIPLIVYELTHSSVAMASMRTAELLPNFLFAIFIGVIVDRLNKKKWTLWMVALQAVLLIVMALFVQNESRVMLPYYVIGFLLMTFNYGYFNAQVSLTKLSVPSNHLTSANAKFSFVEAIVGIMGPALSAAIFAMAQLYDGLLVAAAAYIACLVLLTRLSSNRDLDIRTGETNILRDLRSGWLVFCSNRVLVVSTLFTIVLNSTDVVVNTTVIYLGKETLHLSSTLLAVIFSAAGIGGLAASTTANWFRVHFGIGRMYGVSILLDGMSYLGMFFSHNVYALIIPLVAHGFTSTLLNIGVYTIRHEQTPSHLIGRIAGITGTLFRIGMPVAMVLSGWVITLYGATAVFLWISILNTVMFGCYLKSCMWRLP